MVLGLEPPEARCPAWLQLCSPVAGDGTSVPQPPSCGSSSRGSDESTLHGAPTSAGQEELVLMQVPPTEACLTLGEQE